MNTAGKKTSQKKDEVKKVGVVIFNDYSEEGLAALQWATESLLSLKPKLILLHIKEDNEGSNEPGETVFRAGHVISVVIDEIIAEEEKSPTGMTWAFEFDKYMKKSKNFSCLSYQGPTQEILQGAIKKNSLDTLVVGMAALRKTSTAGHIDLLLNSECSVVLVKKDTKPLMLNTTLVDPDPQVDPKATETSGSGGQEEVPKTDKKNQNEGNKFDKNKASTK